MKHKIFETFEIYSKFTTVAPKAMYSASYDDLEIVNCFLVLRKIRDLLRKKLWPEINLLASKQPSQSASENTDKHKGESLGKNKP